MIHLSTRLLHYKRKDIQEAIVENALSKEVGIRFDRGFGKRPDVIIYPKDVLELAKKIMTLTGKETPIQFEPERKGEIRRNYCDITKAKNTLGYCPETDLDAGLDQAWKWFQEHVK